MPCEGTRKFHVKIVQDGDIRPVNVVKACTFQHVFHSFLAHFLRKYFKLFQIHLL